MYFSQILYLFRLYIQDYLVGSFISPFFSFFISFSQVGFGAIYFSFLYSFFSFILGISLSKLGFGKDFLYSFFVSLDFSLSSSQVRVDFRGTSDLFQVDSSHLYPVLLFLNPVPGFIEFLSQLDFLSFPSVGCFFSKVFPNGFLETVSSVSYLGLLAI